ncbi:TetR family transcriptional regulator [Hypericibacter adhaerens]|jgi:AcrR family transcriptional regulator|uniref:TetR family transcriptional regulator n=2 Tax=Hypericibacter adhaerens TaxID=2602016 RepID=A0A5J6MWP5_9PROT|nr:TetR family transcriptional regulator [Hypericibacter adhaerens]
MDNASRSERSRNAAIQAALTIIARDGPGRLTLDAIAREAGMSKGGVMHQFPTKQAVLMALLDQQRAYFEEFSQRFKAENRSATAEPELAARIATWREVALKREPVAFAILGALIEDPGFLSVGRDTEAKKVDLIKAEAEDPQLALLRAAAAQGLALASLLGISTLSEKERAQLFERLLDDAQWLALAKPGKRSARRPKSPSKSRAS